jgi:hypothetical protein
VRGRFPLIRIALGFPPRDPPSPTRGEGSERALRSCLYRFDCQTATGAKLRRPCSLTGAGYAVVKIRLRCASADKPRARGTPRVLMDPRASTPRDIEACRSPVPVFALCGATTGKPQVRQVRWRPARGVCRLALHRPRWTSHFRQPASPFELEGCLSTAVGPDRTGSLVTGCQPDHHGDPAAHGRCAGTKQLGPPGLRRRISDAEG